MVKAPIEIDLFFKFCSSNLNACAFPDSEKLFNLDKPKSNLPNNNDVKLSLSLILLNLIEVKYCLTPLFPVKGLEGLACKLTLPIL